MSDSEVQAAAAPSEKPKRAAVTYPPARFEPGETIFAPKGRGGTVGVILTAPDDEGGSYTIRIIPGPIVKPRKDGTAPERKALPTRTVVASRRVPCPGRRRGLPAGLAPERGGPACLPEGAGPQEHRAHRGGVPGRLRGAISPRLDPFGPTKHPHAGHHIKTIRVHGARVFCGPALDPRRLCPPARVLIA